MSSPGGGSRSDEFEIGWSSPDLASAVHAEPSHLPVDPLRTQMNRDACLSFSRSPQDLLVAE